MNNASLFKHVLDYEGKLNAFLDKAGGDKEQEERIWMMVFQITGTLEHHYVPASIFCSVPGNTPLVSGKPCVPEQSPIICGFAPKAYAQPWLGLHSLNLAHSHLFRPAAGRLRMF